MWPIQMNITAGLCSQTFCGFELLSPQRAQEGKDLEHKHKYKGHELSVEWDHMHTFQNHARSQLPSYNCY